MAGSRANPLSKEEFVKVKEWFLTSGRYAKRNLLFLMIAVYTGFRLKEVLSLKIKDVMTFPPKINTRISIDRRNMKCKKAGRDVAIHPNLKEYIRDYLNDFDEIYSTKKALKPNKDCGDCPLFPSRNFEYTTDGRTIVKGLGQEMVIKIFKQCSNELQIPRLSSHSCRKTFAKNLYEIFDRDLIKLQKALGHTEITSTQSYISFADTVVDEGVMKYNLEEKKKEMLEQTNIKRPWEEDTSLA